MRWYVASLADGDTHLAEPTPGQQLMSARCDRGRFRPLVALPATPPDQAQICRACRAAQSQQVELPGMATPSHNVRRTP